MAKASVGVAGEALIDLVTNDGEAFVAHMGGGPMNVAIGAARLGLDSAFVGRVADDAFGRRLARHLTDNGVSDRLQAKASEPTTLAVATVAPDKTVTYDFYTDGTADWQWRDEDLPADLGVDVLHLGTLGMLIQPGAAVFERLAARVRDRATVTYDPNIRPALAGTHDAEVERVERQLRLADVVKASDEDLRWLYPGTPPTEVLRRWLAIGPTLVVATMGADGALAVTGAAQVHKRAPKIEVVDTVGAGDSFMAGLLCALGDHDLLGGARRAALAEIDVPMLTTVVTFALACAAITCSRPGADPPTRRDLADEDERHGVV